MSLALDAFEPDEEALTYAATGLPPGLVINPITGVISGNPTIAGAYTVAVTVTDPGGLVATASFPWTVTTSVATNPHRPVLENPGNRSNTIVPGYGYPESVLATSPIGFWRLDDQSGTTATDRASTPHHGMLHGGVLHAQGGALSDGSIAMHFDGNVGSRVEIPATSALELTGGLTVELWAKADTQSAYGGLFDKTVGGATNQSYELLQEGDHWAWWIWGTFGIANLSTPVETADVGAWVHFVATFDGLTTKLYKNGSVGGTAAEGTLTAGEGVVLIGHLGSDVVDLWRHVVHRVAGDRRLELAGQIGICRVADIAIGDGADGWGGIDDLVGRDAGHRRSEDHPWAIAAGLGGVQADCLEPAPDLRHVLDPDPVQLNVLPVGDVGEIPSEVDRDLPDHPELLSSQRAAVDADPQHEVLVVKLPRLQGGSLAAVDPGPALGIKAVPAEPSAKVPWIDGCEAALGVDVLYSGPNVKRMVVLLGLLVGVQRFAVAQRPLALTLLAARPGSPAGPARRWPKPPKRAGRECLWSWVLGRGCAWRGARQQIAIDRVSAAGVVSRKVADTSSTSSARGQRSDVLSSPTGCAMPAGSRVSAGRWGQAQHSPSVTTSDRSSRFLTF